MLSKLIDWLAGRPRPSAPNAPQNEAPAPTPPCAPFDPELLNAARLQWQLGDWEELTRLGLEQLAEHPERARLALLVGMAHVQLHDQMNGRLWLRRAQDWGAAPVLVAQLLIGGVYNTLGRAALLQRRPRQALSHFKAAITGVEGDAPAASQLRCAREFARLGLPDAYAAAALPLERGAPHELATANAPLELAAASPPPPCAGIVSYAQNLEDVMLWRALGHIEEGQYVDVGAGHPRADSVSRGFYERGWRGLHVEPAPAQTAALRTDRPDEPVLAAMVATAAASAPFFVVLEANGKSTAQRAMAEDYQATGYTVSETAVPALDLAGVLQQCRPGPIHWMRLAVEGAESEALAGWGDCPRRPWVVLVNTQGGVTGTSAWEAELAARGYREVYSNGIDRFYLARSHWHLRTAFSHGPNARDNFALSGQGGRFASHASR
ncbi:FkbM family methyltransferase [Pseudoduganella namucuonensis]|uniref:FkbM family methyltransferase n=1 Tax=Pseudoduganella namucuonensis TaxID=1035707 RepID=UPI0015A5A65C|nr:FkbM family methyltransferase [Pseudoduganella namucuonensis]